MSTPSPAPSSVQGAPNAQSDTEWWRGAIIYQIYPRSFADSNGDGVGDLRGCIDHLDHVASLGVHGIWLSPFFTSPMCDYGYDVADYRDVDPVFGTLADFDDLVEKAHARGLKIIIDQVYSHTSDQHAWFTESRQSRDNPKADWYVWADAKPDGSPPSNWLSVFGGSAWTWDARRRQYYLHNFLTSQPDLNLHNPLVQAALLDVARFWLERGVDGFRLDALNFGMHDTQFRDNPPVNETTERPATPYDYQQHIHNRSHPDMIGFIERIRAVMDDYGARFTVAEIAGDDPLAEMKQYTQGETRLNTAYSFDYLYAERLTPDLVRKTASAWQGLAGEGWPSWAFSNHDAPRAVSRWHGTAEPMAYARMAGLLLMSLRGNPVLYQGEELGLPQGHVPFERLLDPEAIANWPETLGRDGARTPIPWVADAPNAGFSTGEPWLPVDPAHVPLAVDAQERDPAAPLHFFRHIIGVRTASPALMRGAMTFLEGPDGLLIFERTAADERVLCAFNFGPDTAQFAPQEAGTWHVLARSSVTGSGNSGLLPIPLAPYEGCLARLNDTASD